MTEVPTECVCRVCHEINRVMANVEVDPDDHESVAQIALLLSAEVREILIAQDRVACGTADQTDIALVQDAARQCIATTFRRLPAPQTSKHEGPIH